MRNLILGGGVAGIGAAYHFAHSGVQAHIFEQRSTWGGLCDNFIVNGFLFDTAIHLAFSKNDFVKNIWSKGAEFYKHKPESRNFFQGTWLRHPVQNNLFPLPAQLKVQILKSAIEGRGEIHSEVPATYKDWLITQLGKEFFLRFSGPYTRKYWTREAEELTTEWIGQRISIPSLDELLLGAMSEETPNAYYANEMRYPINGGYKAFLNHAVSGCDIRLNKKSVSIDPFKKLVEFSDGSSEIYDNLIATIPLPEIINQVEKVPDVVKAASSKLAWTSIALVSLGFNRPDVAKDLWFYIYDEDILPSRAYSPNIKSPYNAPEGCSSLQFEIYHSRFKPLQMSELELIEHVVKAGEKMNLFSKDDILVRDCRHVEYGNVIFDQEYRTSRKIVLDFLTSVNIHTAGRFGHWDYYWSDQSFLSGVTCAAEILKEQKYT